MLRQLTAQDAVYLYMETAETPTHVGGLYLVELPEGYRGSYYDDYKRMIGERIAQVPFMTSRLAPVPFDLDRPFWVVDDKFDLDHHVRHVTVPAPGGMREVEELVGMLHGALLDRSRPLWELYVIDGLESGQVAIYSKIHHSVMDGASSQRLIATLYDLAPGPRTFPPPPQGDDAGKGGFKEIVEGLLGHLARQQIRMLQLVPELLKAWTQVVLPDAKTLTWQRIAGLPATPRTPLNVGISNQRLWAGRTVPLSAVKQIAKETGSKVNDVVLALCSSALRGWLLAHGALPETPLTAMVPVAPRDPAEPGVANQNGMFSCTLATDLTDPLARLAAIHASAVEQKQRFELFKTLPTPPDVSLPGMTIVLPHLVELYGRSRLPEVVPLLGNLVISNVPGPPVPMYCAGAKILSMYPCSIPFHGAALNITVSSYCDRLDFGLIACRRAVPDLAQLADGLMTAFAELMWAVVHAGGNTHVDPGSHEARERQAAADPRGGEGGAADGEGAQRSEGAVREVPPARDRYAKANGKLPEGHRGVALRQ